MAGQVVPLAGFEVGDYRLDVQVTDLLSGKSVSRDVLFTVGSDRVQRSVTSNRHEEGRQG